MKNFTRHFLSMTTAALIGGSAVLNCGLPAALAAEAKDGKLIPVIISLSGDAVLAGEAAAEMGTDYLDTAEADAKAASLRQISSQAEEYLRSLYPELEISYRYDVLMNGFSCSLPAGLLDEAGSCRWVKDITKVETVNVVKPELYTASELSDMNYFGETTGYFGEGEVIAVLDSEFDITHDMFAPIDDKENKLTKDDIAAAAAELNVSIDPERAYISSKLPYVIDYTDDTPYEYTDPENYHGTHVAGIAAGNMISDDESAELSGIARDAQLVMMKVFKQITIDELGITMSTAESDAILAALEDAAKLKADVINLSLGSPDPDFEKIPYKDTITALNNAGIMVVASAGNDSNSFMGNGNYLDIDTSAPDTHTVGEPSAFRDAFCVAAANNSVRRSPCFRIEGLDDEIPFSDTDQGTLSDFLSDDVYEYVYCGLGLFEDFDGKDLQGKIALIDRGELHFWEKAMNAQMAGAIAMIICDNAEDGDLITINMEGNPFPAAFVSMNDGNKLKEAESGKIRLDSTLSIVTPLDGGISEYSSFGPAADLTLKPDIAGIGTAVSSAAYDNGLKQMNGTSMASPYVAGCVAVFDQYLRKNGIELTGNEKTDLIKNIMMNSAVLFMNGDVYESPRRQGAGLVNMKNALNDRVILTGESGLAKVELKDNITSQLSFDVDIRNLTDEDVEFTEAKLVLTAEDGTPMEDSEQLIISGASNIGVTADLSELLTATAQESRTVNINAELSAEDLAAHSTAFPNGFFVEGYIILSGAENCCDISVPVMGFYGDWAQVPIFHNGTKDLAPYAYRTYTGDGIMSSSHSFAGIAEAVSQLLERLPADVKETAMMEPFFFPDYYDEEYNEIQEKCSSEGIYLSPDGDGMAEQVSIDYSLLRSARVSDIKLYNADNELVLDSSNNDALPAYTPMGYISEDDMSGLPEGKYKGVIEAYVFYEGAEKAPQTFEFPVVIDKTAPALEVKSKEENGRKLLEITCTDDELDGVYIMGKGNGGIAGEYTAGSPKLAEMKDIAFAFQTVYIPLFGGPGNPLKADSLFINTIMGNTDAYEQNIYNSYDFSDILPAYRYADENGNISVTYDVTDISDYYIAAVDKAYNTTEMMSEGFDISHLKAGIWWADNGGENDAYYNFRNNNRGIIRYQSGAPEKSFTFAQDGDNITMDISDGISSESRTGKISFADKKNAVITWEDGTSEQLFYADNSGFGSFDYITTPEIKELVTDYHNAHSDKKASSAEVTYGENGMALVQLMDEKGSVIAEYKDFDRFENTAVAPDGKSVKFEYLRAGVYRVGLIGNMSSKHYFVFFNEDGSAAVYSGENGLEWEGTAEYSDGAIICGKGTDDETALNVTFSSISELTVTTEDGSRYKLTYDPNHRTDEEFYTSSQLKEMASAYLERISGISPDLEYAGFEGSGRYNMFFMDGQSLSIDPIGGAAVDQEGKEADLMDLPEIKDLFTAGLWSSRNGGSMKYYSADGKGSMTVTNAEDGSQENIKYNWIGTKAVEFTSGDNTETAAVSAVSDTEIMLIRADGQIETLVYSGEKTIDKKNFYSDKQLSAMAAADRSKKAGRKIKVSETVSSEDGTVAVKFEDGSEYRIDRFTGKGTDDKGEAVDLPQTGNNDISTAAAAALGGILILLGSAAVLASKVLRRKEEH